MRVSSSERHFACTQCGKCCNRSPEVELSEAAGLSDIFVFRLMFRLYWLPSQVGDYRTGGERATNSSLVYFEKKRLLNAFAARKYSAKAMREGRSVAYTKYLVISALALDTIDIQCSALIEKRCGIYDRRPLGCRSVPLHYSRVEALAYSDLEAFVGTSGYQCDSSVSARLILKDGRIANPQIAAARSQAMEVARKDSPWNQAIVRRMSGSVSSKNSLPTVREVEASAGLGATTVPMRAAWRIAADAGLIPARECDRLVELQLRTIRRELASGRCSRAAAETLKEMEAEYARHSSGSLASLDSALRPETNQFGTC